MSAFSVLLPTWRGRTSVFHSSWLSWTLAFAVALAAALVGIQIWQMWHVRQATLRNAATVTAGLAQSVALQVDNTLRTADTVVASIGQRVEAEGIGEAAQGRLYGLMTSLAQALPAIHEMGITDKDGNAIVKSLLRTPVGLNYRERDYFRHLSTHATRQIFIGAPVRSKIDGSLNVTLSRRIDAPGGVFDGVVVSSVSMDFFRRMFETVEIGAAGAIALVSDDGTVLASSRPTFGGGELAALRGASGAWEYVAPDGTRRVGSHRHLAHYPMVVIVAQDSSAILADWRTQARSHAAIVVCVLIALAFLGWRLEQATRHTRIQALRDTLTGLANRRCFNDAIDVEFRRAARKSEPLSYIMTDIDLFKNFNDAYGHQAGDDCLCAVANAIDSVLGRAGDLAARYGGEEIGVLLPETDVGGAVKIAERIQAAVTALRIPHASSPYGIVTISAGVAACVPTPVTSAQSLIHAADRALYTAKAAGRNTFRVHEPTAGT